MIVLLVVLATPLGQAHAAPACTDTPLASGAVARVCLPAGPWAGDVLVYAPGFAPEPGFRNLTLPGGQSLPDQITGAGLAFATSNVGLVDDTSELADALPGLLGRAPRRVLLAGVSQGSLVVTLLAERTPHRFAGALALCGPIGDYRGQVDYFGDMRVLFDYFFPGVLPGDALTIPPQLKSNWSSTYAPAVAAALAADPARAAQLIAVSGAPTDASSPARLAETTAASVINALWYNVFGTDVVRERFGGNPYSNTGRVYAGSADDAALNAGVARFAVSDAVLARLAANETSGAIWVPLVVMHTSGDEVVPFSTAERYIEKVQRAGFAGSVTFLPVERYGHCNFTSDELLLSFFVLNQAIEARLRVFLPLTNR
jgi:pimeloyl-ACP methyl ester carboxylesterase